MFCGSIEDVVCRYVLGSCVIDTTKRNHTGVKKYKLFLQKYFCQRFADQKVIFKLIEFQSNETSNRLFLYA